jgi:DNA-binding SARP family transcriptional activator
LTAHAHAPSLLGGEDFLDRGHVAQVGPAGGAQPLDGPLEVTVDGARANVGGPRQRCVLARLVAAQGGVVSADRLIEDLYADEAPAKALAGVQAFVSHLRRVLEPGRPARGQARILVTSAPGYAVRLGRDAVDAWSFEDEVHQVAALADAGIVHARLSAALGCWRGAAFQEFGALPWADLEASRLEELRLTAVEVRAAAALRLGRAAQVVADLDRLTAGQPGTGRGPAAVPQDHRSPGTGGRPGLCRGGPEVR